MVYTRPVCGFITTTVPAWLPSALTAMRRDGADLRANTGFRLRILRRFSIRFLFERLSSARLFFAGFTGAAFAGLPRFFGGVLAATTAKVEMRTNSRQRIWIGFLGFMTGQIFRLKQGRLAAKALRSDCGVSGELVSFAAAGCRETNNKRRRCAPEEVRST